MSGSVLVLTDDSQAAALSTALSSLGFGIRVAGGAAEAITALQESPSLAIADLDLPGVDGLRFCRHVRQFSNVPLIVVSRRLDEAAELAALDAGADDYLGKPYSTARLLARVRVAMRRSGEILETPPLGVGAFHIDFHDRRVRVHGQRVHLTPKEFDLLVFMAKHPNRVIAHRTLLGAVWGEASCEQSEYLRVFVGQLRKKLETDPSNPRYFVTEPWVGYRFNPSGAVQ